MKNLPAVKFSIFIHIIFSIYFVTRLYEFNSNNEAIGYHSLQLTRLNAIASEIRHSSEWLTKFVRAYDATGELKFKRYFDFVLRVRSGDQPVPKGFTTDFWPAVLSGLRSLPDLQTKKGKTIGTRLKELGASQSQLSKLKNAVVYSDELAVLEKQIFNNERTSKDLSSDILFDNAYFTQKRKIMTPVNEVLDSLEQGLMSTISDAKQFNTKLYDELINLMIVWFILSGLSLFFLVKQHNKVCAIIKDCIVGNESKFTETNKLNVDSSVAALCKEIKQKQGNLTRQISKAEGQTKMFEDTLVSVIEIFNAKSNKSYCLSELLVNLRKEMLRTLAYYGVSNIQFVRLPQNIQALVELTENQSPTSPVSIERTHIQFGLANSIKNHKDYTQFMLFIDIYDHLAKELIVNDAY